MHVLSPTFIAAALLLAPAALGQSVTKLTVNANGVHSSYDSAVGATPDSVTPDGRYTVFSSGAWQLIPNLLTFDTQVYRYDTLAGTTTRGVAGRRPQGPGPTTPRPPPSATTDASSPTRVVP